MSLYASLSAQAAGSSSNFTAYFLGLTTQHEKHLKHYISYTKKPHRTWDGSSRVTLHSRCCFDSTANSCLNSTAEPVRTKQNTAAHPAGLCMHPSQQHRPQAPHVTLRNIYTTHQHITPTTLVKLDKQQQFTLQVPVRIPLSSTCRRVLIELHCVLLGVDAAVCKVHGCAAVQRLAHKVGHVAAAAQRRQMQPPQQRTGSGVGYSRTLC